MTALESIFTVIISISILSNLILYGMYRDDENNISAYKSSIAQLHVDAEEQTKQYEQIHEQAVSQMRQVQTKAQTILRTKIPTGCEESIKWLILESHRL